MRFFTTELNKFKQLKHGHKKQPLHYGDYLQLLTIIVPYFLQILPGDGKNFTVDGQSQLIPCGHD